MDNLLIVSPKSWPEFGGLYFCQYRDGDGESSYSYIVGDVVYDPYDLCRMIGYDGEEFIRSDEIIQYDQLVPAFTIDLSGSELLVIQTRDDLMIYQQLSSGSFIELLPRQDEYEEIICICKLQVPLPGGKEVNKIFQRLPLRELNPHIPELLSEHGILEGEIPDLNKILKVLNFKM